MIGESYFFRDHMIAHVVGCLCFWPYGLGLILYRSRLWQVCKLAFEWMRVTPYTWLNMNFHCPFWICPCLAMTHRKLDMCRHCGHWQPLDELHPKYIGISPSILLKSIVSKLHVRLTVTMAFIHVYYLHTWPQQEWNFHLESCMNPAHADSCRIISSFSVWLNWCKDQIYTFKVL